VPLTQNQGAKIYWDQQGEGSPLLLIMGLGWTSHMWYRSRPVLSSKLRTIAFDNRGVGQSDVPTGPYPIALMASDTAAVLDAAGVESAHICGMSMGGMIAQEFALQYPGRVRSLILGCTAAGGPHAVQAERAVIQLLLAPPGNSEDMAKAIYPYIYDTGTSDARKEEDLAVRRPWFPTAEGYLAQLQGIMAWEAYSRLPQITAPTLVIHGESDRLVPPENGRRIAARLPNARLEMIPRASHIFPTDQTEVAHRAMLEFLNAHANNQQRPQNGGIHATSQIIR
jgi:pimeloyl-ACP methyl ester carboxylesterase